MIELPVVRTSAIRAIASGAMVMRSSASAGLFGTGSGLAPAGAPPATLRRRAARSSSSVRAALRAVTGSETTDQRNKLGSFLSASAVNTCVPSGRSLGAMVIGTSNCGLKFSRTYSLESLRLTNTAIWPGRLGGSALAAAPGGRAVSFFTSGAAAGTVGASATALTASAGFSTGFDSVVLDSGVLDSGVFASSTFGASILAGSALAIAAVGASAFTSSDFVSEVASTFASPGLSSAFTLSLAETSVFVSSPADGAGAAAVSAFWLSVATVLLSADLISAAAVSAALAAGSDFGASALVSAFDVSLAGWTLAADDVASDMATTALIAGSAPPASAVWVCSRNG